MRALAWLSPLTLLFCFGCSKGGGSYTMSPGADYGYGGELPPAEMVDISGDAAGYGSDGGYDEYDFAEDLSQGYGEEESISRASVAMAPSPSKAGGKSKFKTEAAPADKGGKDQPNVGGRNGEGGEGGDAGASAGEPGDDNGDQPDHGRQIIYVAGLQISVYDLEASMNSVESIPDRFGGWVHMRTQNQVVLRIPANQLKAVMRELSGIGVVEARSLQAQDVTAEYVDLESRIKVLRETQAQLLDLLGKAKTVEEALHVRSALDNVTMELEVALGRMRQLGDMIAFSTLTVTLLERGPQDSIPTSNDPFRWVDELGVEATEWR
ncbi:MAG: DUF4349 domain-containing protein [Myxococcales bacterium]|nr:DUF4349 domain-containing protein [Myxococcales bacterium]